MIITYIFIFVKPMLAEFKILTQYLVLINTLIMRFVIASEPRRGPVGGEAISVVGIVYVRDDVPLGYCFVASRLAMTIHVYCDKKLNSALSVRGQYIL